MRRSSRWLPAVALLLAACADRSPSATTPPIPAPESTQRVECVASPAARTVSCGRTEEGARRNLYGGQGQFVQIASNDVFYDSGTGQFTFDLTVQNLLPYPIGTRDGTTVDSGGVKVFVNSGPTTTGGSGSVTVPSPDGVGTFTAAGQPFYKYPQRLAPNQVSASRTWAFQVEAGVATFSFTLLVEAQAAPSAFRILAPLPGATVSADSLHVKVTAKAPPMVNFIRATVSGRSTNLAYTDSGGWQGKVRLIGLPAGPTTLRVVAVAPADSTVETVQFTYVPQLDFALAQPLENAVARPQLQVQGSCTDNTSCTVTAQVGATVLFTSPGPAFGQTVSFAPWEGTRQTLTVTGRDTDNNTAQALRTVYVESTPRWAEFASGNNRALSADSARVLFRDSTATGDGLRLLTRATGTTEVVIDRNLGNGGMPFASVFPAGAVYTVIAGMYGAEQLDSIFEFRGGALSTIGSVVGQQIFLNGKWLAWRSPAGAMLRDLETGTTTAPSVLYPVVQGVGPNGDVLYTNLNDVWRWRAGTNTRISTGGGRQAKTDGNLIVFRYQETRIGLYDGTSTTAISGQPFGWEVNNGWVAFTAYDPSVTVQVWVRRPDASFVQASQGSTRSLLVALGPSGEVIYSQSGRRYYTAPPYASRVDVGADWGAVAPMTFHGSIAYAVLGRSAFTVGP